MKVQDVMTKDVLTIGPEASIRDVAKILVGHGISGLPICDERRRVVGIVSEGDILFKEHDPTKRRRGPLAWLLDAGSEEAAKSRAETAGEAMSAPVFTIGGDRPIAEAARLMVEHRINRLPVVEGDELVGIVTRADLVRAFTRSDEEIEREIRKEVVQQTMWLEPDAVKIDVERGHVRLAGHLESRADTGLLERLTGRVPGVIAVESALTWTEDDTSRKGRRSLRGAKS
jgi:CBS domain-containing protein